MIILMFNSFSFCFLASSNSQRDLPFNKRKEHRKTENQTGKRSHFECAGVVGEGRERESACIRWKVSEVEESDKQIKKVSEGEGDKVDRGGKENKGIKVL